MSSRADAREVLVNALDQIDNINERDGEARHVYLVAAYAYQVKGKTTFGWATTDDPSFVTSSLLRVVADNIEFDEERREID